MEPLPDEQLGRAIVTAALGHDPGPMTAAASLSHRVFVGSDVVVKVVGAAGHTRLDREVALAPHLPAGLLTPLLAAGRHRVGAREFRYACYARAPGTTPGFSTPGVDATTARALAEQAVDRLGHLHRWTPGDRAADTLGEPLDHGGFVSRAALHTEIETLAAGDRNAFVPGRVLDGLTAIAERAPQHARTDVPVHADCHWGNWLATGATVTALLDFEWARFGEPLDDWFFLIADSGPHVGAVLAVVARATALAPDVLRAACELREATHLASDLRVELTRPGPPRRRAVDRLTRLEEVVVERPWWRTQLS